MLAAITRRAVAYRGWEETSRTVIEGYETYNALAW